MFIGGSDATDRHGDDEAPPSLARKTGRGGTADPSLGVATEPINRRWYEKTTGGVIKDVQTWVRHPVIRWMAATLDGIVEGTGAVFEAKFMLPWSFSEEAAAEKHMPQLQHNMWVTNATAAVLSIITGGGKWVEIKREERRNSGAASRVGSLLGSSASTQPLPNLYPTSTS